LKHTASKRFWQCLDALPAEVQALAKKNLALLTSDPAHPSLSLKLLGGVNSSRFPRRNSRGGVPQAAWLGLTKYRLAKDFGVAPQRIGDIVAGKRAISADTDLRLCRYFGLSDGWWLRGQASYDTAVARESMRDELARIPRCTLLAA